MEEPRSRSRRAETRWAAALVAVGVVLCVFPDVVFFGASFSNSQILKVFEPRPATLALIPETDGRMIRDGYRDLGSAAWQLEPAQRFIRRCLVEGESPYWNPYSACGTHGPERLVSVTFSALTVATALLGAGVHALHAVLLAAFVVALYCLYRALTVFLGRSATAAVASCFAFLLVGFHISMLGAQMVHPYILSPILLRVLLALVASPTPQRFAGATLASSLLLAETFLPTALLTMICVHALCLAYGAGRWTDPLRDGVRQLGMQGAASVLGLLLLAPLIFPVIESLPLSEWNDRPFMTARPRAVLSLATPKHFWESYDAFGRTRFNSARLSIVKLESHRVYHLGVVALLVAVQAFAGRHRRRNLVVVASGVLMAIALGRMFGVFPLTLIEHLPVFRLISYQYWGLMLCFPFCVLLAYGVDALSSRTVWRWPTVAVLGSLGACFFFLLGRLGFPDAGPSLFHLRVLGVVVGAVVLAFAMLHLRPRSRPVVVVLLVAMIAGELIFYMNRLRPERSELDFAKIRWVEFLRTHIDGARVLNVGGLGLYPNWGSALAIPQIDSLDGVNLRWYSEFFHQRFGKSRHFLAIRRRRSKDTTEQLAKIDLDALDLLGVRYITISNLANYRSFFASHGFRPVLKDKRVQILENPDPFPRAFVVGALLEGPGIPSDYGLPARILAVTTDREVLAAASEFGVRSQAPQLESDKPNPGVGIVEITEYRHARVVLSASLEQPGLVILTDTWHPSWRAKVNGKQAHIGRVNEVLRGVALPAGQHHIVMSYAPQSLPLAIVVSLITAAYLSWKVWVARR